MTKACRFGRVRLAVLEKSLLSSSTTERVISFRRVGWTFAPGLQG